MLDATPAIAPRSGVLAWLIGFFALWQLAFIPLSNAIEFVPLRPSRHDTNPPIETAQRWGRFTRIDALQWSAEGVADVLAFWGEATGQDQGWVMFTPGFPPHTVVLAADFHFADGTRDRSYSRFLPADLSRPAARWPVIHDREFNFEANIFILAWDCDSASLAKSPEVWKRLPERVRENEHLISAWLRWQTNLYRAVHPEKPEPVEVVLVLGYVPTPLPGEPADWTRREPFERPFARWRLDVSPEPGFMPIEGYDPVACEFVPLKVWPRP